MHEVFTKIADNDWWRITRHFHFLPSPLQFFGYNCNVAEKKVEWSHDVVLVSECVWVCV